MLAGLGLVCESLDRVLEASLHHDRRLAEMVVADDDRIDAIYTDTHSELLTLLACRGPVAGELRLVAALLEILHHVERMGDQCVNIAKILPLNGYAPTGEERALRRLAEMGAQVRSEVAQAQLAFETRDPGLAEDLVRQDQAVNRLNREIFQLALEAGGQADRREWAMHLMLAARALERIGDNAVDIGEQVAFVVSGVYREFRDASAAQPKRPLT
ncbi:MAG: phosphate transport system protein [Thermoleophilaceae bacterium]|nr:phosphate transport system protein [Thermoleophilaceae bacterium]